MTNPLELLYVRHLGDWHHRPNAHVRYEVQLLDEQGRARVSGYFGDGDTELTIEGLVIPTEVMDAARQQASGSGAYVNNRGEITPAF